MGREWEGNGNKTSLNLKLEMGMNHSKWERMGLKKTFPLIPLLRLFSWILCLIKVWRLFAVCTESITAGLELNDVKSVHARFLTVDVSVMRDE